MTINKAIDIIKCLAWHTRPDEEDIEQAIKVLEQQPCEDAISREDTLKTIIKHLGIRSEEYLLPAEEAIYKVVKNMPPVTPIQRWIPIEEKSPKENGNYLVTKEIYFIPDHVDDINHYRTVSISYYDTKYSWLDAEVYAWMPIPKSYEVTE